jgi:hypothetical protein
MKKTPLNTWRCAVWSPILLLLFSLTTTVFGQAFIHPGMLHTDADFMRMKANYQVDPWLGSWNRLIANPRSQTTWNPRPVGQVIRGGTGENYGQFFPDVAAAYQSALRWKITGDTAYANQSIRILNGWSYTMTNLTGNADRFLAAGIYGYEFANAAEIMRTYSGWSAADQTQFKNYLLNVFYPLQNSFLTNHNDACIDNYWANWDLCNVAGMAAIGIFCDDRAKYNQALNYFKTGAGEGSINRSIPFIYTGTPTLGQGEEEGRDQGHSGLDVSLWGAVCQQFYNQGDDMWGYNANRVLAACEYFAKYNAGGTVPFTTFTWGSGQNCAQNSQTVISSASRGDIRPSWDIIYNHYQVLKGISSPNSAAYAASIRPEGGGGDYGTTSGGFDQLGYTTLTCSMTAGAPIGNGTCRIRNQVSGRYLDNLGVSTNGAPVSQWDGGTSNNQKWIVTFANGYYTLSCVTGGRLMDSLGHTGNGSTVGQWQSSGSQNQQWTIASTSSGSYFKIINRANGLCLDTGGNNANGATMQFWASGSSGNQLWQFMP